MPVGETALEYDAGRSVKWYNSYGRVRAKYRSSNLLPGIKYSFFLGKWEMTCKLYLKQQNRGLETAVPFLRELAGHAHFGTEWQTMKG